MVIRGGKVLTEGRFIAADIQVEGKRIAAIAAPGSLQDDNIVDAAGCYVLPGFVDIHSHGCVDGDFCDADPAALERMLHYYGSVGVTSVVPATMSFSEEILARVLTAALPYFDREGYGSVLRGVNMEGPFINVEKKGAQNGEYIMHPDLGMFRRLNELCRGRIMLVDTAPELPGSEAFIREAAGECVVSIAHTAASYEQAAAAFKNGASHVTHMFNAMPPFNHREPGVIGAASDFARSVEIISDGIHLHPSVVRAAFQWFAGRVCLVSDSMRAAGMPNGEYTLGGQRVVMQDGKATLEDGTIAGSATNLADMVRHAVSFGVPLEQAAEAASLVPAAVVGLDGELGSLQEGKRADILLWNQKLETVAVFSGGEKL